MAPEVGESVRLALDNFSATKAMIESHFAVGSADEIVSVVLKGGRPRAGDLSDGATYFVHGIGYTVTLPPERLIHIDASTQGDSFSVYDLQHYLADASTAPVPDVAELTEALDAMVEEGRIGFLKHGQYLL
jgi:hypothetical protein